MLPANTEKIFNQVKRCDGDAQVYRDGWTLFHHAQNEKGTDFSYKMSSTVDTSWHISADFGRESRRGTFICHEGTLKLLNLLLLSSFGDFCVLLISHGGKNVFASLEAILKVSSGFRSWRARPTPTADLNTFREVCKKRSIEGYLDTRMSKNDPKMV